MTENADDVLDRLERDFPRIGRHAIVRQMRDATESVQLFGIDADDGAELVERLVRSHLEALDALRQE